MLPVLFLPQMDTEGFDAAVIQGALNSIAQGRVGVVHFEYHGIGLWSKITLRSVVEELAGFGYIWCATQQRLGTFGEQLWETRGEVKGVGLYVRAGLLAVGTV